MKHEINDKTLNISFDENLVATTVGNYHKGLKPVLDGISEGDITSIVIDITKVSNVDSLGLNFLVGLYQEAEGIKSSFKVTGVSEQLQRLFDFVKLSDKFGISS